MASPFHRGGTARPCDRVGDNEGRLRRTLTECANDRFVRALLRYGVKHGLPNTSGADCRARLAEEQSTDRYTDSSTIRPRGNAGPTIAETACQGA